MNWLKAVPDRLPDFIRKHKLDRSYVWFEEMLIQRDSRYKYAEQPMNGTDGMLSFIIDNDTGQRSHIALEIQVAYKKWLDKKIDKELLG